VAYDTMDRVRQNVETIIGRLRGMKYRFEEKPRTPPGAKTWKLLQRLEAKAGPVPLSLRTFWEVVGEVNLMGSHESVNPEGGPVGADPLVVYGVRSEMEDYEEIIIAPDSLHKANTSGGDPYSIGLPAAVADAVLEYEPHGIGFVSYLRLAFAWGGFPGWENADAVQPAELESLKRGLLLI